jgi:UDP-N-acetylmuramate dehydrogenase
MLSRLRAIPGLTVTENVSLAPYTRFGLGGPALAVADAVHEHALIAAIRTLRESQTPWALIGGGTNLIVADGGFPGVVLRYTADRIRVDSAEIEADAGAVLQALVDCAINCGLAGLESMTGIPGWAGGAIYGNAGAYGQSIGQCVALVRCFAGETIREMSGLECQFRYRESVFKRRKDWIVLSARLRLRPDDAQILRAKADGILKIRNEKYPPALRCAGSIFKNLLFDELPVAVRPRVPSALVREGKVPSAYFLEQIGAKGMIQGGIRVANYHANLLYNHDTGTASEARKLIETLKIRVREKYGLELEEEVQYVGSVP